MGNVNLGEVTETEVGCWIDGSSVRNPIEFSIAIVELAIDNGMPDVVMETWRADREVFLDGEPSFDMIEDLGFLTDAALDYLNTEVREGFFFDFNDGLYLFKEEDTDEDD